MRGIHKTGTHMFAGAGNRRVACVEIHLGWVFNIAQNHRPLKKMNMLHLVNDTRGIV